MNKKALAVLIGFTYTADMTDDQRKFLLQQLKTSMDFQDRFFEYQQNARLQLLSNQLQHFQSIAGIALAMIAALLATGSIDISLWWVLTGACALLLVIYASTHTREQNDGWDKSLNREEESLERSHQELEKIILKAVKANDFLVYESHVMSKGKPSPIVSISSYAGEIAVFLFLLTLLFGIVAFTDGYIHIQCLAAALLVFGGTLLCFVMAVHDWNLKFTERISAFLHHILKKPIS